MERTYESAAELAGRATGPLVSHLVPFVTSLIDQQYAASIIYIKARHALAVDRWLAKRGVVLGDLGEVHIERYQRRSRRRHRPICTETWRREYNHITQLVQFLRDHGVCPGARIEITAAEELAARYEQHLHDQQGLASTTIRRYRTIARQFLHERFGRGVVDLRALCAGHMIAFVPCCCCWRGLGFVLTRSSRCNSKTVTGTAATCVSAARVGVSNSCRCPRMWALPSLPICSRDGP